MKEKRNKDFLKEIFEGGKKETENKKRGETGGRC